MKIAKKFSSSRRPCCVLTPQSEQIYIFYQCLGKKYVSVLSLATGSAVQWAFVIPSVKEPELAAVCGSQLLPAAAPPSSLSPAETLLRLIQGEIMGPAISNPLWSRSHSSYQAGQEGGSVRAQGGRGCQKSSSVRPRVL